MFTALVLLAVFSPSSSAPLTSNSNTSHIHLDTWKRDSSDSSDASDLRTTQGIVWSCIATIFACAWVAIHPNLPDPRSSSWTRFKHRTGIMMLAVFAPEFIMVWAVRQRLGAERIMKEYNMAVLGGAEHQPKTPLHQARDWFRDPLSPSKRQTWTLTHGFYAQMGGFLFYDKGSDWPVRVLDFHQLLDLIQSGAVDPPNITEEEIFDKSKGDFLTKTLVVLQTTWFIVQCIARWITKLPVTELEIMTLSFAVLNIITYQIWWEKPQNVAVGMCVQMNDAWRDAACLPEQPCAVEVSENADNCTGAAGGDILQEPLGGDLEANNGGTQQCPTQPSTALYREVELKGRLNFIKQIWVRIRAIGRIISGSLYLLRRGTLKAALFTQLRQVVLGTPPIYVGMTTIRVTRPLNAPTRPGMFSIAPGPLTVGTFYAYDAFDTGQKLAIITCATASGILFGGLHLIPWRFTFPTHAESLLWRVSALYIMLNPVFLSFPLVLFVLLSYRSNVDSDIRSAVIQWLPWMIPPIRTITITIPLYIFARLSIIILAFVTLRDLPPEAYKEVPWDSFIPHIGS